MITFLAILGAISVVAIIAGVVMAFVDLRERVEILEMEVEGKCIE